MIKQKVKEKYNRKGGCLMSRRAFLFRSPNNPHSSGAETLTKFVRTNHLTGLLLGLVLQSWARSIEETVRVQVSLKQAFNTLSQVAIFTTSVLHKIRPRLWRVFLNCFQEYRLGGFGS